MERQQKLYKSVRSRKRKAAFIDKIEEATGYDRKRAIRLLNRRGEVYEQRGARKKLTARDIDIIKRVWQLSGYPNAQYLRVLLPRFLHDFNGAKEGERITVHQINRILSVSYKTIERALQPYRFKSEDRESMAIKAAIKSNVELVEHIRHVSEPGYICVDTVAHGGKSTAGDFIWTLTWTDVHTGFTINRAIWNKGYAAMEEAFDYCLKHTPFPIVSINSDNGREFLNYHLLKYWGGKGIKLTHSRPYHKNDNAHAEQKNRTHVRELFARVRLEKEAYVESMNEIYQTANLIRNYFMPCKILVKREYMPQQHRSKRIYDEPKPPYTRLLKYSGLDEATRKELKEKEQSMNYASLCCRLRDELDAFFWLLSDDPAVNT